jgi:hypothetical protein
VALAAVLIAAPALTGCSQPVAGHAKAGPREVDQAYFFAGEVPTYGQTVSASDTTALAYLRALRRVDVCGLVSGDALAKIGEISSVGTLFAFDECDLDLKMSGASVRKFVAVELLLSPNPGAAVVFRVGETPVYGNVPDSCDYMVPLDLARLPGARPLHKREQPFVKIDLIGEQDCAVAQRITRAVAERLSTTPLPARDAVAVYPSALAERDPCEVLSAISADVDHWNIGAAQPYECRFGIWRSGLPDVLSLRVHLEPQVVDIATQGRTRREQGGVEVYVDKTFCSAVSFVGAPMQRRLLGGGYVDPRDVVVRPAVVVDTSGKNCDAVADVTTQAARLYA